MKIAGIYARVSTADQTSVQQIETLKSYCEKAGYKIFSEYILLVPLLIPFFFYGFFTDKE